MGDGAGERSVFDEKFTNLYSLSKTLRFELKPTEKTLENMKRDLDYRPELQTFMKDQDIEDAYQTLKPVLDQVHEEFISKSLESEKAQDIVFGEYFEKYKLQAQDKGERELRRKIGELYNEGERFYKEKYPLLAWNKGSSEAKGAIVLECQDILQVIQQSSLEDEKIQNALNTLKGSFTYFGGFNQNRANYYKTEGKSSQIATRIVDENLPKFCDNAIQFEAIIKKKKDGAIEKIERKEEYKNVYQYLQDNNKTTQIKDAESGKMIEAIPIEEEIFDISYFPQCLSQKQIEEYNRKIGHYNLLINLYNQAKREKEKDLSKDQKTFKDLPKFKTLYKQIGCGKKKALFFALTHDTKKEAEENKEKVAEPFSVEEVLELARKAGEKYFKKGDEEGVIKTLEDFLLNIEKRENYDGVYWSKRAVNSLSNYYLFSWQGIVQCIEKNAKDYKTVASFDKNREEKVKMNDAVELSKLFEIFEKVVTGESWWESFFRKAICEDADKLKIIKESETPGKALMNLLVADIRFNMKSFCDEKEVFLLQRYDLPENKDKIKAWIDLAKDTMQMFKYFQVNEAKVKGLPLDSVLSNAIKTLIFEAKLDEKRNEKEIEVDWFKWYDALRNYLTQKIYDKNKLLLNFQGTDGLDGSLHSIMLREENDIYFGFFSKGNSLDTHTIENNDNNLDAYYEKLFVKVIPNPSRSLPGYAFPRLKGSFKNNKELAHKAFEDKKSEEYVKYIKERVDKYDLTWEIWSILIDESYKTRNDHLIKIIDYYKIYLSRKDTFNVLTFHFKKSDQYKNISEFMKDVDEGSYILDFREKIAKFYINKAIETGKLYLFKIYSKDFSKRSLGKKNLQTYYFHHIFEPNSNVQFTGYSTIFYRKPSIEKIIDRKRNIRKEIIKNKRYSEEKFLLHFYLSLNVNSSLEGIKNGKPNYEAIKLTNDLVCHEFSQSEKQNIHFLGIDRGEKHLAYFSLINQKGEIVDQGTLNLPFVDKNGNPRIVKTKKQSNGEEVECHDYNELLEARAGDRDYARKNWQTIGTIKELKEGYISQLVRTIADLSVKHNAFIVLEDLNTGFKRGRQKIEKSVYQKFELGLAKKLNFLVDKTAESGKIGSVIKARQLTPPVQNYQDIEGKKQVGIMLYTRANYTSQTDPLTGWRRNVYLKYDSKNPLKFLENFKSIERQNGNYIFTLQTDENTNISWKFTSNVDRYLGSKNSNGNWEAMKFNPTEVLTEIFSAIEGDYLLDHIGEDNLKKYFEKKTAVEGLIFTINVIMQIRNSGPKKKDKKGNNLPHRDDDFLHSPIIGKIDKNGKEVLFDQFDSRHYWDKEQEELKKSLSERKIQTLPTSGDANGAFNIARKGFLMNEHIKQWIQDGRRKYKDKQDDLNLFVSDEEWDLFLSSEEEWKKKLPLFASKKAMEKNRKE